MDAYSNDTGFPLTAADQLTFQPPGGRVGPRPGLAVGLKNDLEQVAQLEPAFDFAVNEQCHAYDECELLSPFVPGRQGGVFTVEYDLAPGQSVLRPRSLALLDPQETCPWTPRARPADRRPAAPLGAAVHSRSQCRHRSTPVSCQAGHRT